MIGPALYRGYPQPLNRVWQAPAPADTVSDVNMDASQAEAAREDRRGSRVVSRQTHAEADVMARTSAMFNSVHDDLKTTLDRLMVEVESVRSEWQGRGGASFQVVTSEWRQDQDRMLRALSETASAILIAGRGYSVTDEAAGSRMTAIHKLPL